MCVRDRVWCVRCVCNRPTQNCQLGTVAGDRLSSDRSLPHLKWPTFAYSHLIDFLPAMALLQQKCPSVCLLGTFWYCIETNMSWFLRRRRARRRLWFLSYQDHCEIRKALSESGVNRNWQFSTRISETVQGRIKVAIDHREKVAYELSHTALSLSGA